MTDRRPVALTIAGTDSGGGAGVLADAKTFQAHGAWSVCAVVAVTAQNTVGVQAFEVLPESLVVEQLQSVVLDIGVDAAKTGMLASASMVAAVAAAIGELGVAPLVVDPVLVSKHGDPLLADAAVDAMRELLLPRAAIVTPNLPEAERLVGFPVASEDAMVEAGRSLVALGAAAALVKGGHLGGGTAPDCLVTADAGEPRWLRAERVAGRHTHGTGCVLSAAITARLARGEALEDAVAGAKSFVTAAIRAGLDLGQGVGPVDPGVPSPT